MLWIALGLAFSPVWLDLAEHFADHSWARYALLFPLLFARCARRDARVARAPVGTLLIAAGLALEVFSAFAGAIRWSRPGLAIAAIGLCQREGIASWPTRALLLFAIPLPSFAARLAWRAVSNAMGDGALMAFGFAGNDYVLLGTTLYSAGEAVLTMSREWLSLAPLLAGLAWYDALLRRRPLRVACFSGAVAAAMTLPIQGVGLGIAVCIASLGARGFAQGFVDDGIWLAVAVVGLGLTEWRVRRATEAPA